MSPRGRTERACGAVRRTVLALLLGAAGAACRQDMHDQPKYRPLREDAAYFTGKSGGQYLTEVPVAVTKALLVRGQERFQIFCAPCHGRTGRGDGMIVQRGFKKPSSYHVDRLRQMPIGYFYDVITNGFGAMADYSAQVPPADRWAIAAYVRTLQYSQYAPVADVPADKHPELDKSLAAAPAATSAPEHH